MEFSSYGGPRISPGKKLTWGTERLVYILRPCINIERLEPKLQKIVKKCDEWAEDKKKSGQLEIYNTYHVNLMKQDLVSMLKDKKLIFATGRSPDRTECAPRVSPHMVRHDWNSHEFRLSEEIQLMSDDLNEEYFFKYFENKHLMKDYVFGVVGPFLFFHQIGLEDGRSILDTYFGDALFEANKTMFKQKKNTFGTLEKRLDDNSPQKGTYEFSDLLYLSKEARKAFSDYDIEFIRRNTLFLPDDVLVKLNSLGLETVETMTPEIREVFDPHYDKVIQQSTLVNRKINCAAIEHGILEPLGIKRLAVYAAKTSYVFKILEHLQGDYSFIDLGVMDNVDRSAYRECDPSALAKLKGYIAENEGL